MSTLAGEFWVCGECRSINNAGAKQCYNCRTPKDRAAVDPETIDPSTHGKLREIALPEFRWSRWAALLASILILVVAVMQIVQWNLVATLGDQMLRGIDATEDQFVYIGSVGFLALGIALLALIAWSLWLSRTVASMPALGLGYPAASGLMAFVENFIPFFNLFRVPAIVRDVVRRLEPKAGRGEALIFAAWISLLGGYIVPRVLGFFIDDLRTAVTVSGIATGLTLVGAVFLVALIWWIEGRIARRRAAQLAEAPAVETTPTEQPATTRNLVEPLATRSAFAAVGTGLTQPDAPSPAGPAVVTPPATGFSLPPVESVDPPDVATDDAWAQITARRMEAAPVRAAPAEPAPVEVPAAEPPVVEAAPAQPAAPVEMAPPIEVAPPMEVASPIEIRAPVETPASVERLDAQPAEPLVPVEPPEPATADAEAAGPPHLTIKVGARGMITAEVDGEVEHVILDDLSAYADALAKVDGTAAIQAATDDPMAGLIARRAQRILDDAGVQVTVD